MVNSGSNLNGSLGLPDDSFANEDEGVDFRELVGVLIRRWRVIMVVALFVFVCGFMSVYTQRKMYQSSAKLIVSTKDESSGAGGGGGGGDENSFLASLASLREGRNVDTQAEIIGSKDLINKAFVALPLSVRQKGFTAGKVANPTSAPDWSFEVKPREDTDVIVVTAAAFSPSAAAAFANSIANTYLSLDSERNSQATRQARQYVQRQMGLTKAELIESSKKLAGYQRQTGLIDPQGQVTNAARVVSDLQAIQDSVRMESAAANREVESLKSQLGQLKPEIPFETAISENPEYTLLRQQLVQLQGSLLQAKQEYAPKAPEISTIQNQIKQDEDRLQTLDRSIVTAQTRQVNPVMNGLLSEYGDALAKRTMASVKVEVADKQLKQKQQDFLLFPESARKFAELLQGVKALNRTLDMLSDRYYALLIEEQSTLPNGMVADTAKPPAQPYSPKISMAFVLSLVSALVCGIVAGAMVEKFDTKLHRPEEAERISSLPVLCLVPEATPATPGEKRLYFGDVIPNHAFSEALRLLRNNISFASPDRNLKCLAVTSSTMGEGKSTISANLAIALVLDGKKVCLVDVDLRRPAIHKWMKCSNDLGLTSVVRGDDSLEKVVRQTSWFGLDCLTSGPLPPDPSEFLNSRRCQEVIKKLAESYDYVVLDAPPCPGMSDVQVISKLVDGVVVVAALEHSAKPALQATLRLLRQASAPLLGIAINRVVSHGGKYGYYGYFGYYGYYGYDAYADKSESGDSEKKAKSKV